MKGFQVYLRARRSQVIVDSAEDAYRWLDEQAQPGERYALSVRGSLNRPDQDQRNLLAVRSFLAAFARETIKKQPRAVTGSKA